MNAGKLYELLVNDIKFLKQEQWKIFYHSIIGQSGLYIIGTNNIYNKFNSICFIIIASILLLSSIIITIFSCIKIYNYSIKIIVIKEKAIQILNVENSQKSNIQHLIAKIIDESQSRIKDKHISYYFSILITSGAITLFLLFNHFCYYLSYFI
jgi:hypothetical protein